MSNGAACCAIEVCCSFASAESLNTFAKSMADHVGHEGPYTPAEYRRWMQHHDLSFAPASMRQVIQDVVTIAKHHRDSA